MPGAQKEDKEKEEKTVEKREAYLQNSGHQSIVEVNPGAVCSIVRGGGCARVLDTNGGAQKGHSLHHLAFDVHAHTVVVLDSGVAQEELQFLYGVQRLASLCGGGGELRYNGG